MGKRKKRRQKRVKCPVCAGSGTFERYIDAGYAAQHGLPVHWESECDWCDGEGIVAEEYAQGEQL